MRCSSDLRKRGIDFVRGGGSKAEAARRFQVSRASVYHWVTAPDGLAYQRPGPRGPRRLDWAALRAHVQQYPALTQKERAQHFRVSRHCIWYALRQMGVTWKKNAGLHRAESEEKENLLTAARALEAPGQRVCLRG